MRSATIVLALLSGCSIHLGGTSTDIVVSGIISGLSSGSTIKAAGGDAVQVTSGGAYTLRVRNPADRLILDVNAFVPSSSTAKVPTVDASVDLAAAPTRVIVFPQLGVYRYHQDITLPGVVDMTMQNGTGGKMMVESQGRAVAITVPPMTMATSPTAMVTVRVAGFDAANGPGVLDTPDPPGKKLQTAGMFYVQAIDATGADVGFQPGMGIGLAIPPFTMENLPDADGMKGYLMDAQGRWTPQYDTATSAEGANLQAQQGGFWNADRAVRTACVRTRLTSSDGRSCGGERVRADGLDGIASFATVGAAGSVCIENAVSRVSMMHLGSTTRAVMMPDTPGNCANPTSCLEVDEIMVNAGSCAQGCTATQVDSPDGCINPPKPNDTNPGGGDYTYCSAASPCCTGGATSCGRTFKSCADAQGGGGYVVSDGRRFYCASATQACLNSEANATISYCNGN